MKTGQRCHFWTLISIAIILANQFSATKASFIGGLFRGLTGASEQQPQPEAEERFMRPPINREYAATLRFLSSLPLNERINYVKAGLLRTGANALAAKSNWFSQSQTTFNNAANDLYQGRPPPPPPGPFPGIGPRAPALLPGSVESIRLTENPEGVDEGLNFGMLQDMIAKQRLVSQQQRLRNQQQQIVTPVPPRTPFTQQIFAEPSTCPERLGQLVGDIFIGHEMIPQVLDLPPDYPLELTYRTVRTFPGMRLTAEATRFKPMMHWPSEQGVLYTIVMSNLDINSRRNRTLSEFWHWFVANVPGNSIDEGQEIFQLLHPLVLPEGSGDHRFGYFVMKQPSFLDYNEEGGPTDNCSPVMSAGRGPFRSTKEFIKKYGLKLVAATFIIVDASTASIEIACEWQACMGGEVFLKDLECDIFPPRLKRKR